MDALLRQFEAILFDLNGTLAHGYDRFGPQEDYHATYRSLGGRRLARDQLTEAVKAGLSRLMERYENGASDDFPRFRDFIPGFEDYPETELALIEDTVAEHELGEISDARKALLTRLAGSHRLGLVSNLWAPARRCRAYLAGQGLDTLFGSLVFSCEIGAVKPSRKLFDCALDDLGCSPSTALFVGDDLRRDIAGAGACGMSTVWISGGRPVAGDASPDRVIADIGELLRP